MEETKVAQLEGVKKLNALFMLFLSLLNHLLVKNSQKPETECSLMHAIKISFAGHRARPRKLEITRYCMEALNQYIVHLTLILHFMLNIWNLNKNLRKKEKETEGQRKSDTQ